MGASGTGEGRVVSTDVTPQVAAALDAAAIPQSRVGPRRHARLTGSERKLYFWILSRFAENGRPSGAESRAAAERFGLDADSALATLAREDLVHTNEDGEIAVAYPFSGRTTEHVVLFKGGHEVHAMCAIDALGIAPMFDQSIDIVSRDPLSRDRIGVALGADGTASWRPEESVVVCGASGDGESCCSCCPVLNFFASSENGERWLEARPDVRGYVMTMREAIDAGRAMFGDVFKAQ